MPEPIVLKTAAGEFELKLTMRRVELVKELTGIDMMTGESEGLGEPRNSFKVLYALVGGPACGLPYDEFSDSITVAEFARAADLISQVVARDSNVEACTKGATSGGGGKNE